MLGVSETDAKLILTHENEQESKKWGCESSGDTEIQNRRLKKKKPGVKISRGETKTRTQTSYTLQSIIIKSM